MRTNSEPTIPSSFATSPFSIRWSKKARSSSHSFSNVVKVYFRSPSAKLALSERSAKAISGSIIQNSARWRLVFEFSARKVGPRSEEHTSELQSLAYLVCRLLLEKKKK